MTLAELQRTPLSGPPRSSASLARHRWALPLLLAFGLVAATLAVYLPVCRFEFVDLDDMILVAGNVRVTRGLSFEGVRWAFSTFESSNWMPLSWLSFMLDATLYGPGPQGFHITNLALHLANVLLVFATFGRATGNLLRSAFVAGLFAVHPLHIESVAWISERKDVLSLLFGLSALYVYVRYAERPRAATLAISFALFVCSLLSKQTLVTLPFVLLLLDYWPLNRLSLSAAPVRLAEDAPPAAARSQSTWPRLVLEKVPFFVASVVFSVVVLMAQSQGGSVRALTEIPFLTRLLNAVLSYGLYAWSALFPYHLAPFYPHPGSNLGFAGVGLAFLCLAAATWLSVFNARRRPFLLVGWLWYLGTLVPMIGLVQVGQQQLADRYAYFPFLGLYVAVAWSIPSLHPGLAASRRLLPLLATAVILIYAGVSIAQIGNWHDSVTLFSHSLEVTEDNSTVRSSLASALVRQGRLDEALANNRQAVKLEPTSTRIHDNLGRNLHAMGRTGDAEKEFRAAIALNDTYPIAHNDLGAVLMAQRRYREAEQQFLRAIELNSACLDAFINLGALYGEMGDFPKSIRCSERALELYPGLIGCHLNIGMALVAEGRLDDAIQRFKHALAISPNNPAARQQLDRVMAMKGRRSRPVPE